METKINEQISVSIIFDHIKKKTLIKRVLWKNRVYKIQTQGLRHTYKRGSSLFHVFSVSSETISFRIIFNTDSLTWTLEEIYDPISV